MPSLCMWKKKRRGGPKKILAHHQKISLHRKESFSPSIVLRKHKIWQMSRGEAGIIYLSKILIQFTIRGIVYYV